MTEGQYRVGIDFNLGDSPLVRKIKQAAADLIDIIATMRPDGDSEVLRLQTIAMIHIEDGAMWAVKAATKPAR
jgi:hypothetical protein